MRILFILCILLLLYCQGTKENKSEKQKRIELITGYCCKYGNIN